MKYKFLLLLLLPLLNYGQVNVNTQAPSIMPSNPQAYEFTPYGSVPVGKYSGTANVSVPLYTISARGFEIPISLQYNTTGVKVNEEASWVGLGWSLSEGGSIIQNVYGNDDYGTYRQRFLPDFGCIIETQTGMTGNSVLSTCSTFYSAETNAAESTENEQCGFSPSFAAGIWDSEPDRFTFNFLNYSGEFIMDWDTAQFTCITDKRMKIISDYINPDVSGSPFYFTIITPDGNRFFFQLKEETQTNSNSSISANGGVPVAIQLQNGIERTSRVFKLIRIITTNAEVIEFNYSQTASSKNLPYISQKYTTWDAISFNAPLDVVNGMTTTYTATEQSYNYLSSITFTGGEVRFITSSRTDLKEAKKLDRVEVYAATSLIQSFSFAYDYFNAHTSGTNWDQYLNYNNYSVGKTASELTQRLKLLSMTETGKPAFTFQYNTEQLPKKTSYATDYWGYYSGYLTNDSFLENIYRFNVLRDKESYLFGDDNNKSPSLQHTKAAVLERINYPTGGFTNLEYELNSFDNYKVPVKEQGPRKAVSINTRNFGGFPTTQAVISTGGNTIFEGSAAFSRRGCTDPNAYSQFYAKILRFDASILPLVQSGSNGMVYELYAQGFIDGTNPAYNQYLEEVVWLQMEYNDPEDVVINNLRYNLGPGLIVFVVNGACGTYNMTTNTSQASLTLTYREYLPLEPVSYGGGLRVKSVSSQLDYYTPATYKTYAYEGGKLQTPITLFNSTTQTFQWRFVYYIGCFALEIDRQLLEGQRLQLMARMAVNPTGELIDEIIAINQVISDLLGEAEQAGCGVLYEDKTWYGYKNEVTSESFRSPSFNASGRYVGYDKVTETETSLSSGATNGRIEEYYINNPDLTGGSAGGVVGGGMNTDLSVPFVKQFPQNGLLKEQKIFDKANMIKKHTLNAYTARMEDCSWGMKTISSGNYLTFFGSTSYTIRPRYSIGVYPIKSGTSVLTKTTEKSYDEDGINYLTAIRDYDYDSYNQLSYIKESDSEDDIIETYLGYIYDYPISTTTPNYMLDKNMIEPVVRKEVKVNSETVQLERNHYKLVPITFMSANDYTFVPDRKSVGTTGNESALEDQIFFTHYDLKANLMQSSKPIADPPTCYLWGYGGRYIVAVIEGATYSEVVSSGINMSSINNLTPLESVMQSELATLRQNLPNAMVTAFIHKPMIGLSCKIDPSGNKISYIYDEYNRLKEIRDRDNNIIEEYKYHYKNQ